MTLRQAIEVGELLDSATVSGEIVADVLRQRGAEVEVRSVKGARGETDFVRVHLTGLAGKAAGGEAPTLGVIGQLGGVGARPSVVGMVSDADGAMTALTCALKLADMAGNGDRLAGDVIVTTHICPAAPTIPHQPVPFMGAPVDARTMSSYLVQPQMDAILSVDTTRGNWIINRRGFAISPTVKEGYILKVSPDLLRIMANVTGQAPAAMPITTQDITPYGNGIDHVNSIMQPAVATRAPVVGVAITAETVVPGCASGASQIVDVEAAARFCIEVAKAFRPGAGLFYDADEFARLRGLYGSMEHLQTLEGRSTGEASET